MIGPYDEKQVGEWSVNRTVLTVRTRSEMDGVTVFEDLRIFSYDNQKKRIRMRQFAWGDLAIYDIEVKDGGRTLVFNETAHEGTGRPEWRYTFAVGEGAWSYVTEEKRGAKFGTYVKGKLALKK